MMRHLCSRSGKVMKALVSVLNEFVEEIKELMRK